MPLPTFGHVRVEGGRTSKNLWCSVVGAQAMPSSETVALYLRYAESCVKLADSHPTISVRLQLLAMARVWSSLAKEADEKNRAAKELPATNSCA